MTYSHNAPFRADVVGSYLRPAELKQARADFAAGAIDAAALKAVEDRLITELVAKQKAAAKLTGDADASVEAEPRVIVVGDVETNQARQWVAALGGESNILAVEPVAETRVRVEVRDTDAVDEEALRRAGLAGAVQVAPGVWHLVAGLEADQYAEGMRRRLAAVNA